MRSLHIPAFTLAALLLGCGDRPVNPVTPAVKKAAQKPVLSNEGKMVPANNFSVTNSVSHDSSNSASDQERIQGRWDFVTLVNGPRDFIDFSQDNVSFHVGENIVVGTFVIDSATQPKRLDLTFAGNVDGPAAPQGIYEFQKDLLAICLATTDGVRPTEFKGTEKQNLILFYRPTPDPIRRPK